MDNPIMVNESKEAGLSLLQLVNKDHPVRVGFWMKTADEPNWLLYIGGDWVKHTYSKDAYEVVISAIHELNNPDLFVLDIRVIAMDHPLAKAALNFWEEYPGKLPVWYRVSRFGDSYVDRVYLYPQSMINDPSARIYARQGLQAN